MRTRLVGLSLALAGALACSVTNREHCGNLEGDATCKQRDADAPYCSVCVAANDGCVDAPATDACRADSAVTTQSADPTSTGATSSTGAGSDGSSSSSSSSSTSTGPTQNICGDNIASGMENCDGLDFRDKTCTDFAGYGGGTLLCDDCKYNFADCCFLPGYPCDKAEDCCPGTMCEIDPVALKKTCQ